MNEIEIRNEWATKYDSWYLEHKGYWVDKIEKDVILKSLSLKPHETVLDAGCGTGRITGLLSGQGRKVCALDNSAESLKVLQSKNIDAQVFCGDVCGNPFGDSVFDKIVSVQTLQHVPDYFHALVNFYHELKLGGTLVFTVYNTDVFFLGKMFGKKIERHGYFPSGVYYQRFEAYWLRTLLEFIGFKDISVKGLVNIGDYNSLKGFNLSLVAWLDEMYSKTDLSTHSGTYLIAKGVKCE